MTSKLSAQPQRVPVVDPQSGVMTPAWYRFILDLTQRVGGTEALTNLELAQNTGATEEELAVVAAQAAAAQTSANTAQTSANAAQADIDATQVLPIVVASSSALLPNGRVLTAGTNTTVDVSTPGQIKVNSTASATANITPDTQPASPNNANDEFEYGTQIDTTGARRTSATVWALINATAGTNTSVADGALILTAQASGSDSLRCVSQASPGSSWKYRAKMSGILISAGGTVQFGIGAYASSNGRFMTFATRYNGTNWLIAWSRWTSSTTMFSDESTSNIYSGANDLRSPRVPIYLEWELSGGTLYARYSDSGISGTFKNFYSEPVNNWLSVGLTDIVLFASTSNSADAAAAFDWFRRIS